MTVRVITTTRGSAIPFVQWSTFADRWRADWKQGEHVTLVGPTGQGKTTLGLELLRPRSHALVIATKPVDPTLDRLRRLGWQRIREWPPRPDTARAVLWPLVKEMRDVDDQRERIRHALHRLYVVGRWAVFADEVRYLAKDLGLQKECELIWLHGRSLKLSFVVATQRPRHIPLEAYDQATHLFFWRDNDVENLRRIGGIGSMDAAAIRRAVARLPKHEVLYVNTRDNELVRTKLDLGAVSAAR